MTDSVKEELGKYMLIRHLATGGMAEIWLAEQEGPGGFNKQLVIKRVLPHLAQDSQFTQMFLDEARLVAQLAHPNIGQIYELGEIEGSYFIAMEYIEGVDGSVMLESLLARKQRLPIGLAVYITEQVLQALDYAHNFMDRDGNFVGLVHRDVTPHNVIISNDGVIKLVDFGVAKARANQSKTQTGAVKGKFAYMAPEQIASVQDLDRRVDLFAVGVMFYELLTGEKPFGEDLAAVNAILNEPTPDPRVLRPEIPQSLVNILNLALAKERGQRYQGAQALMDDLQEFMMASGFHGTQRELAAFVRELQGLEVTHSWQTQSLGGPRARITEREQALTSPATPHALEQQTTPLPSDAPPALQLSADVPQLSSRGDESRSSPLQTISSYTQEQLAVGGAEAKSSAGLLIAFLVVVVGILGAGGVAVYLFMQPGDKPEPKSPKPPKSGEVTLTNKDTTSTTKPPDKKTPPSSTEKADPSVLMHQGGTLIFVRSKKPAKVYFDGKYLGTTPFKLAPRPGKYELVIKNPAMAKATGKKQTIEVKEQFGTQSFDVAF